MHCSNAMREERPEPREPKAEAGPRGTTPHRRPCRGPIWDSIVLLPWVAAAAVLLQAGAGRAEAGACIVASAQPTLRSAVGTTGGNASAPPPPSEREIATLLHELEWVELEGGGARRRLDLGEEGPFEPARLRVLLADSLALLASLHAEEAASHLAPGENVARARLLAVQTCAQQRFAARGGQTAYAEALERVRRKRRGLEAALLGGPAGGERSCCLWDALRALLPGGKDSEGAKP